jgi:hypothetical protein
MSRTSWARQAAESDMAGSSSAAAADGTAQSKIEIVPAAQWFFQLKVDYFCYNI